MKDLIIVAEKICNKNNNLRQDVFFKILKDPVKIYEMYRNYNENEKFLYVATKDEIEEAVKTNAIYVGAVNKEDKILGLAKLSKLSIPEPFFVPPTFEKGENFYGESGLYVDCAYRNMSVAKLLTQTLMETAKESEATGIYGDFDYRNVMSGKVFIKYFDMIGCTDGTQGSEQENTTYLTFYKSFKTEPSFVESIDLDMRQKTPQEATIEVVKKLGNISDMTRTDVSYCGGFNSVYSTNDYVSFGKINIMQDELSQ